MLNSSNILILLLELRTFTRFLFTHPHSYLFLYIPIREEEDKTENEFFERDEEREERVFYIEYQSNAFHFTTSFTIYTSYDIVVSLNKMLNN